MSKFDLQQWLEGQFENNVLLELAEFDDLVEVEFGGFGFPHYAELDSPSTIYYLPL